MPRLQVAALMMALASMPTAAGDFDALVKTIQTTWPERRMVVVVCDKNASSMTLMDLGSATENTLSLLVLDLPSAKDLDKALATLRGRKSEEMVLLLLSDDPKTGEASFLARTLISRVAGRKIPTVGTTPGALRLGAVLAQGPATGDKVQVNREAAAKVGVSVPEDPKP